MTIQIGYVCPKQTIIPGILDILTSVNVQAVTYVASAVEKMSDQEGNPQLRRLPTISHAGHNISTDRVFFKDVVGLDTALQEVSEVVEFLKNAEEFKAMGATLPKGILLEGPPGCGKTLIAKAVANEAGCAFFYETASNFVEMYVGVGASRIRDLFNKARANSPAIVFIDEIDAIGAIERGAGGNAEYRQTLNQLLTELDGFNADGKIVVIAATNFARALDSALTRAGRFDRIIRIDPPNEEARLALLKYYIGKLPRTESDITDSFLKTIAAATSGLSAVDFKVMVNEAPMIAIRGNDKVVAKKHIAAAFERVMEQRKPANKNNVPDIFSRKKP